MSDEHAGHHPNYFAIFCILAFCTLASWIADELKARDIVSNIGLVIVLVLGIAAAKALFVMMYFMHLKFEGRWKYLLLAPTIILATGIPLALLPDIGLHYYTLDTPQSNIVEPVEEPLAEVGHEQFDGESQHDGH